MTTVTLVAKKATVTLPQKLKVKKAKKPAPYNKKQAIHNFQKQYPLTFDMKDDAIDLREMSKNYTSFHGIIPVEHIFQAITTVLGPKYQISTAPFDPSGGVTIDYPDNSVSPRFEYVDWDQIYLWSIFQRDVAPNHIEKIYNDFEHTCVIVPCAIKITLDGKVIYCVWDGHHTLQVCHYKNYIKTPMWVIDIDHVPVADIVAAGFAYDNAGRIAYGCWLAGTNMRRINSKNKRPLSPYDDFLIGYETQDAQYVAMMNILRKNNCVVKRHASAAGAFTQIKSGIECYDYADGYGNKGIYWDRALNFNRTNWPGQHLVLEIFRPMSMLYHQAATQGIVLPASFDKELAAMLIKWSVNGDAESIQEEIKESFWTAYHNGKLVGTIPVHDKERVLAGLINFYKQHGGKCILPLPSCQWIV